MEKKIYKLKHEPTGLYFQPHKQGGSHLSKSGKIYQTASNGLSWALRSGREFFSVQARKGSLIHRKTKDILNWEECEWSRWDVIAKTKVSDWIKEYIV